MKIIKNIGLISICLLINVSPALAAKDFYIRNNAQTFFYVSGTSGNVGIGSLAPGQALDVNGTVRQTGFILSNNGAAAGNIMVTNGVGLGTWMSASTLQFSGANYWVNDVGNVGINTTYNIGVGTIAQVNTLNILGNIGIGTVSYSKFLTFAGPSGGMAIEGKVGIGTSVPAGKLAILGNVGIGTIGYSPFLTTTPPAGGILAEGNIGIGTWTPVSLLHVYSAPFIQQSQANFESHCDSCNIEVEVLNDSSPVSSEASLHLFTGEFGGLSSYVTSLSNNDATGSDLLFQTENATGFVISEKMRITALGNVGIGSQTPGQKLDVQGTVRTKFFTMSGQTPASGYVLTASDSAGDTTWTPTSSVGTNYWTLDVGNVGINTTNNVGIGTISQINSLNILGNIGIGTVSYSPYITTAASSGGMNIEGNVGIGTIWVSGEDAVVIGESPTGAFEIMGKIGNNFGNSDFVLKTAHNTGVWDFSTADTGTVGEFPGGVFNFYDILNNKTPFSVEANTPNNTLVLDSTGNVGIGTFLALSGLSISSTAGESIGSAYTTISAPTNGLIVQGNVGLGSLAPGQALDVQGTVRTKFFTMSGQTPASGYVLTASDSAGDTTWTPAGSVAGWTVSGNNVYETLSGNVGIGTTLITTSALSVMNGNVGIGTWAPGGSLVVKSGNVGIGTDNSPDATLEVTQVTGSPPFMVSSTSTASGDYLIVANGGNVGIGSIAPGQKLDVQGTARMTGFTLTTGASNGYIMVSNGVGIGTWMSVNTLPAASIVVSPPQDVAYYSNTVSQLIGANGFVTNGTNVGIGTSGLSEASLQVVGNIGIGTVQNGDNFILTSPPKGGMIIEGNVGLGTYAPGSLLTVMNGNVGIGTTKAVETLQVATQVSGGVRFNISSNASGGGNLSFMQTDSTNVAGGGLFLFIPEDGLSTTEAMAIQESSNNVGIGTFLPSGLLEVGTQKFDVLSGGNVGIGTITPAGGLTVMNGNVGIGTWVPAFNLDLVNDTERMRVVRRVNTEASGSPVTINSDQTDLYTITALAVNLTFNAPTGTPNNGDLLEIRILDNGTARTLTWTLGAAGDFLSTTTSLPATTVISTTLRVLLEWNSASSRWECIGVT